MSLKNIDTIIIGAGLSGIYAASLLARKKLSFLVLEARGRIGGRILSIEYQNFFPDLGPSWYWPEINPKIVHLVETMGLTGYRQFEEGMGRFEYYNGMVQTVRGYKTYPASWRLAGGMNVLVEKLSETIPKSSVKLNSPVCEIKKNDSEIVVITGKLGETPYAVYTASRVIIAMPPRLCAATILFTPDLSHDLTQAMLKTGTWMAGQAKFYALYESSCWREKGFSGQAFSQKGPLGEIHDASNADQKPYGLTGFLSIPAVQRNHKELLIQDIFSQLAAIYGTQAGKPLTFFYQDWAQEQYTATEFDQPPMHEHPVYQPPAGKISIWDNTILFAGSETADQQGGYLEGALNSAERAVSIFT